MLIRILGSSCKGNADIDLKQDTSYIASKPKKLNSTLQIGTIISIFQYSAW
jgi:hypothetical protein